MSLFQNPQAKLLQFRTANMQALYSTLSDYGLNPGDWMISPDRSLTGWYRLSHRREKGLCLFGHWNEDTHWHSLEWYDF